MQGSHAKFLSATLLLAAMPGLFVARAYAIDAEQEQRVIEQWRMERVARLTRADGWLTLVALYWMSEGENTFGRAANNAFVLDHVALPTTLGVFSLHNGKVTFRALPNSAVFQEGRPVTSLALTPDSEGTPTVLTAGSLAFHVIERAGKLGIRVRDTESPGRKEFHGLDYFPISAQWAVDARFEAFQPQRTVNIVNVLGQTVAMTSPGAIVFTKDGKEYRLDTVLESPDDTELFVMFADATTARESYGAGRFLYIPRPKDGHVVVDFNKAYNPPCAFSDFATCPLPPRQNRLALRVEAGEKKYVRH